MGWFVHQRGIGMAGNSARMADDLEAGAPAPMIRPGTR
jgi:hypothetical protein